MGVIDDIIHYFHGYIEKEPSPKELMKYTFFRPYQSKPDFALHLSLPLLLPVGLGITSVGAALFCLFSVSRAAYHIKEGDRVNTHSSFKYAGLALLLSLCCAVLTVLSPILALGALIGRSVSHLSSFSEDSPDDIPYQSPSRA